ncbi:transferase [Cunninghamella echinulata]|nr:transferase [Cunninghamella echinulata]
MTTILKSYRVKPSQPINDFKKHKLEGLDKNNYFYTTIFFGYDNKYLPSDTDYGQVVEKMKGDISILQNDFPMIAGSIENNYEENNAQVIYDGSGVVVVEAENNNINISDLTILKDNNDSTSAKTISDMFTPDLKYLKNEYHVQHFPFVIQITKLKCNSIILTLMNSHMLMDGYSYELLQRAWKSISKGLGYMKPDDKKIDYAGIEHQSVMPKGWIEIPRQFLFKEASSSSESQIIPSCRLHFSKNKINQLKEELNKLIKEDDESKYVTSDEIVCSLLWKAITRHRKLDQNQHTTFIRPTNIRNILKPMLSDRSFGNLAIMDGICLSSEEILSSDILQIIKKIQLQKEAYNKDKILQNLKYFTELPFDKCLVMDFAGMAQNDLLLNSWSKFSSLASFNIGFGNNVFVSLPPLMNGAVLLLPSCFNQEEGIVAHVNLQDNILKELANDSDLLNYLC